MIGLHKRGFWMTIAVLASCAAVAGAQASTHGTGLRVQPPAAPLPHTARHSVLQQPSSAPGDQALAGSEVTVRQLVRIALARNPAIKSAAERFQAERARVPQARSLPDPTISGGWMGHIVPFAVEHNFPPSFRGLTVKENFPFPGKLKLRGEVADRQAEASGWEAEQTRRQVVSEIKTAYYNYFYFIKAIAITKNNKSLLEKLESIAEARYRVGKGIQQDVLRAQIEVSRIDQKLIILEQQEKTAKARINTLLYRDPESPLPPPAPVTPAKFTASLRELYALARANDAGLQRSRRMVESGRDAVDLAQKAYKPNFSVSYSYQQRPDLQDSNGFMVGINIPIFFRSKQREGVIEASHNLIGAERSLDARETTVDFKIKQEYLAATASRKLMNLYSKAIVPQSSLALESAMSAYEVGKVDFVSMLDNFIYVLNYEVNYYQEVSNFEIALARLEPLVNRNLTD
jgi:outer membrane protein TolC